MMKRLQFIAMLLALLVAAGTPAVIPAEDVYREVTASGAHSLTLAVDNPRNLGGADDAALARDMAEVLRFDMTLAGPFSVVAPPAGTAGGGIRPGEFDLTSWKNAGVDLLVKCGYSIAGDSITMEFRLYNATQGRELAAKRYTGKRSDLRRIVHTFSDDIMQTMTGERGPFTGKIAFVSTESGTKEIYLMDYDGHNVQRLTKNRSINLNPDFSPNGRELLYTSYRRGNPDLFRREIFTGTEAVVSSQRGINVTASWSPDGKQLALAMSRDGNSEIYVISRDGKETRRLTTHQAIDVSPTWSPDGRRIAFVSDRLGKPQVFVMNVDGSDVRRLTTSGAYNVSPRWSPKGDRIVYCRQEGGFQLYSIAPDGTDDTRLTSEGSNEHPRWSPDGRFLTFSSTRDGGEAIYVMRSDGSGQTRVYRRKGKASHPTWSPRW